MKRNRPVAYEPIKDIRGSYNKAMSIFHTMYSGMKTSDEHGTIDTNVPNGYNNYFVYQKGKWNYKFLSAKSSYGDFKNALNDNCPVHLQLRMSNYPWESEGHDVFALGYASSTSGTPYILVMDGWNNYGRFVKYDYFPLVKGYKIWVS